MRLNVFLNIYGNRLFVGVLEEQNKRVFFEYAPEFVNSNIPLSPFMLPLKPQVYEDEKCIFDGLFGVFNDSLPDGWGCLLLDRKLQKKGLSYNSITPLQRLSLIGLNAMGALEYEPITEIDKEFVGDIGNEADRLNRMSQKLLSLTRIETKISLSFMFPLWISAIDFSPYLISPFFLSLLVYDSFPFLIE